MIQVLKDMLEFLMESFHTYSGGNKIWILYVISLPIIFFLGKKEDRKFFLGSLLVECVTIFNPFFVKILVEVFGFENRYLRFFWMLVYFITIAYALVLVIFQAKRKMFRAMLLVICVGIILFIGKPVFYGKDVPAYSMMQNVYFADYSILELSNVFHGDGIENPRVLYGGWEMLNYRQYDPTITSFVSRDIFDKVTDVSCKKFMKSKKYGDEVKTICRVYFYNDFSVEVMEFYDCVNAEGINYIVSGSSELDEYLEKTPAVIARKTQRGNVWKVKP